MLCKAAYTDWDGTESRYFYTNDAQPEKRQLARIEDPGDEVTDFAYNGGRLTTVRDPLLADALRLGLAGVPNDDTTRTVVAYDSAARVASVTLPAPASGAARPGHTYQYESTTDTHVHVVGLDESAAGFARRVIMDAEGRTMTDIDGVGHATQLEWGNAAPGQPVVEFDRLLSSTDFVGRRSTVIYDGNGLPTESHGPAPVSCFGSDRRPNASCPAMASTTTTYDAGISGLAATWWPNPDMVGPPSRYDTGVGHASGALSADWGASPPGTSARFSGEVVLPEAGTYTLTLDRSGFGAVWIDGRLVSETWSDGSGQTAVVETVASGGADSRHRIEVEFRKGTGGARIGLMWSGPGASGLVPGTHLRPHYGLVTRTTAADATPGSPPTVTEPSYLYPHTGMVTSVKDDPDGLALMTSSVVEPPGAGWFRRTARTLPAGNATSYEHYGPTETRDDPCQAGTLLVNQGGRLKRALDPDPDGGGPQAARTAEYIYDGAGRVVAAFNGPDRTCVTYDSRGRVLTRAVPAFGGEPARTVTTTWAVGNNPFVTSTADPGTVTATADRLGRLSTYSDAQANTTSYTYDQPGRQTGSTGPGLGWSTETAYDAAHRVRGQKIDGAVVAQADPERGGRVGRVQLPQRARPRRQRDLRHAQPRHCRPGRRPSLAHSGQLPSEH